MKNLIGIDISRWQGRINPQKLIDYGIAFVIHKAGEVWINQEGDPATDDRRYDENMTALREAEIPLGSYYYYHPSAGNDKQLRHYKSLWKRYEHDFPPILDVEDNDKRGQYETARQIKVMLEGMEEFSGRKPIIYTRNGFWVNQVGNPTWSDDYQFWLAQYPKLTNKSVQNIIMHQFTDNLAVPGCPAFDGNYWLGTEEEFNVFINKSVSAPPIDLETYIESEIPQEPTEPQPKRIKIISPFLRGRSNPRYFAGTSAVIFEQGQILYRTDEEPVYEPASGITWIQVQIPDCPCCGKWISSNSKYIKEV